MKTEFKGSGHNGRLAFKALKIVLAILTFPLHVIVSGSMIWAWNFKEIMTEEVR